LLILSGDEGVDFGNYLTGEKVKRLARSPDDVLHVAKNQKDA